MHLCRSAEFYRELVEIPKFDPDAGPPAHRYMKLADHIALRIKKGDLRPGMQLPPEKEFAQEYNVAGLTMRNALKVLRERNLIVTLRGKGSYILNDAADRAHEEQHSPAKDDQVG